MLLSGFMCLRDAIYLGYPFTEVVVSVIDQLDEMVLIEYFSSDDTYFYARRIQERFPDKVRLVRAQWPEGGQTGSSIGIAQTKAIKECRGDWVWLIQADEVYSPESAATVRAAVQSVNANSLEVSFWHIQHNFQSIQSNPAYSRAIRVARNQPGLISEHDGWQLNGTVQPTHRLEMPQPIFHCSPNQQINSWRKHINHARLYPDLAAYQTAGVAAAQAIGSGDWPENARLTDSPLPLPNVVRGLVGDPLYHVRPDLLRNYRRYIGLFDLGEPETETVPSHPAAPYRPIGDVIRLAESVQGWLTAGEGQMLHDLASRSPRHGAVVEVGSWKGRSSVYLAHGAGTRAFHAIDHFNGSEEHQEMLRGGTTYDEFMRNMARVGAHLSVHRATSEDVEKDWDQPVSLIFIDGDHHYEHVLADVNRWVPHILPGGWLCLHDIHPDWQGPLRVFNEISTQRPWKDIKRVDSLAALQVP